MYNDDEEQRKTDEEYMRELYLRFRKEVDSGQPVEYYELNELLDIYDYAQDEGDLLVQFFVFLTASRLYPEHHEFDERMAFFLSYVSSDAANDMINRGGRENTPLWDVLRMGVKCYPNGDPEPFIIDILKCYDKLDCESTLKIIDLLRELSAHDILAKYYTELSRRAEDRRGFAFETAETLKERDETRQKARDVAEELTTMEPFNVDAWLLLARLEFALEHVGEALAAVDYALAIDPEHFNAKVTRGVILVGLDDRRQEAIQVLSEILEKDPRNIFALEGLAESYAREGDTEKACEKYGVIMEGNLATSNFVHPIQEIIKLEPANLEYYLDIAVRSGAISESEWQAWMFPFLDEGRYALVARVIDCVYRIKPFREIQSFYISVLYIAGWFERLIAVFEESVNNKESIAGKPGYFTLLEYIRLAASYLRVGRHDEAVQLADAITHRPQVDSDLEQLMKYRGMMMTAQYIKKIAMESAEDSDLRNFDPLTQEL